MAIRRNIVVVCKDHEYAVAVLDSIKEKFMQDLPSSDDLSYCDNNIACIINKTRFPDRQIRQYALSLEGVMLVNK